MQTLPVIPVETLAVTAPTAPTAPAGPATNTGVVPPWLLELRADRGKNPGIVPPWLQHPVRPDHPVDDDVPRILGAATPTAFDREPVLA